MHDFLIINLFKKNIGSYSYVAVAGTAKPQNYKPTNLYDAEIAM